MAVPESWYSEDAFWQLFAPVLFSPERMARAAEEVDKIEHMLQIGRGARVLDLCCGTGRHSLELARRGHKVAVRSYSAAELASLLSQCGFAQLQA